MVWGLGPTRSKYRGPPRSSETNTPVPNGLRFVLDTEVSPHEDEDEGPPQEHAVDNDVVEESVFEGERTSFLSIKGRGRIKMQFVRQ